MNYRWLRQTYHKHPNDAVDTTNSKTIEVHKYTLQESVDGQWVEAPTINLPIEQWSGVPVYDELTGNEYVG